jgi:hypothetical protein
MTDACRGKLILGLEQYLILEFKLAINDMLVVGQTKYLVEIRSSVQAASSLNINPFMYTIKTNEYYTMLIDRL